MINIGDEIFSGLAYKKRHLENILQREVSWDQILRILVEDNKKIYIVPKKKKKTAILDEIDPVIHI